MKFIMYHYVRPSSPKLPFLKSLHIADFRKQLDYFEENFGIVNRSKFVDYLSGKSNKMPKGVVLTFDDGLADHFEFVFPELQRRNLWGIFYVSSGPYQNQRLLNVHRAHYLLGQHGGRKMLDAGFEFITEDMLELERVEEFKELTYLRKDNDIATLKFKRLFNYYLRSEHRNTILDKLTAKFIDEQTIASSYYVKPADLKEMQDHGMIVGGHTVNHPVLSTLNRNDQISEIADCFKWIETAIGPSAIRTFCFPYGGEHSFNQDTLSILSELNCCFSLSVEQRDVNEQDLFERPLALPRFDCNQFKFGQVRN